METTERGSAAQRAAVSLLATLGGSEIILHTASGDATLSPVVIRRPSGAAEFLVAASTLEMAGLGATAKDCMMMFNDATGIHAKSGEWKIEGVDVDEFAGMPYLYRLKATAKSKESQ